MISSAAYPNVKPAIVCVDHCQFLLSKPYFVESRFEWYKHKHFYLYG